MPSTILSERHQVVRFLLIGLGPHAKRTYAKHLGSLKTAGQAELVCILEVESKRDETVQYRDEHFSEVELFFVPGSRQACHMDCRPS